MRVLLTGGTGTISRAVVSRVLAEGHQLSVLNRGNREPLPAGVEHLVGDAHDEASLTEALGAREFDAVVQFVAFTPDQVERDLRIFSGRAGHYVFVSSASVYAKPVRRPLITDDGPVGNPFWEYAREKIACEDAVRGGSGDMPWTIVRPSHTYGERQVPLNIHGGKGTWVVLRRILEGRPVVVHGDGESLWTFTWNEDFAVGLVGLLGNTAAFRLPVHITADESLTWNEAFRTIGETLGREPDLVHVSTEMLAVLRPALRGTLLGDKANSVIFDNTRIRSLVPAFDARTTYAEGVARAWAWIQAHEEGRPEDPDFDAWCDRVVARVRDWSQA